MTTKTAQFTQGPWVVKPMGKQLFIESEYPSALTSFVCDMQFPDCQSDEERETAHANAHLIAAAPVMYGALLQVREMLLILADNAGDVPEWNTGGELYELAHTVRTALAQAEGSKP